MASAKYAQNSTTQIPLAPDYPFVLGVEESFDVDQAVKWFNDKSYVPFAMAIGLYLPSLYVLTKFMANREPLRLRGPLIVWNTTLAIFSIVGFARVVPEFYHVSKNFGFLHSICNNSFLASKPAVYWIYLFVLSKTPELVDTIFLVLKKQKLIFLHVYHHATVVIFAWFIFANRVAAARWFCTMNFGVHSIMYTYYALKALPNFIRIPKWIAMLITISQTFQMVAGTYVVVASFIAHMSNQNCSTNTTMSFFGLIIYVSYLILFSHFFYKAYISPAPLKAREDKKKV